MSLDRDKIAELEKRIGYSFKSRDLLIQSLTHSSATESGRESQPALHYERLEFLGDRVLALCIGDMLFSAYDTEREGELSARMHRLVSGKMCAQIAEELELARFAQFGREIKKNKSAKLDGILADIVESLLAAIYLDGGLAAAEKFVGRAFKAHLHESGASEADAKSALQEWAHKAGLDAPQYRVRERAGPDHSPVFTVRVTLGDAHEAEGAGESKRAAQGRAACNMLVKLGAWTRLADGAIKEADS